MAAIPFTMAWFAAASEGGSSQHKLTVGDLGMPPNDVSHLLADVKAIMTQVAAIDRSQAVMNATIANLQTAVGGLSSQLGAQIESIASIRTDGLKTQIAVSTVQAETAQIRNSMKDSVREAVQEYSELELRVKAIEDLILKAEGGVKMFNAGIAGLHAILTAVSVLVALGIWEFVRK